MSDTPRTDKFYEEVWRFTNETDAVDALISMRDLCRELERENAALKQRIIDDNKAYGCELRDPSGTIWDHAKRLQDENAELREARDQLTADFRSQAKQLTQCNRELAQEISQRKIREQLAAAQKEATP